MGLPPEDAELVPEPALPISDFKGHIGACSNAIRGFVLAYLAIYYLHGGLNGYGYPAYGRAAEWDISWMWPILLRNIIALYVICGGWDWVLHFSSLKDHFKKFKLTPEYATWN